eukprot:COSAG04_NODE_2505_length_3995_cov_23.581366_2_plen_217_part_00
MRWWWRVWWRCGWCCVAVSVAALRVASQGACASHDAKLLANCRIAEGRRAVRGRGFLAGCWRAQRSRNHAEAVAHAAEHRAQGVGAARGPGRHGRRWSERISGESAVGAREEVRASAATAAEAAVPPGVHAAAPSARGAPRARAGACGRRRRGWPATGVRKALASQVLPMEPTMVQRAAQRAKLPLQPRRTRPGPHERSCWRAPMELREPIGQRSV